MLKSLIILQGILCTAFFNPSDPISVNNQCGIGSGPSGENQRCGDGLCCSFLGTCGSAIQYCGLIHFQCQQNWGICGGPDPYPAPGSHPPVDMKTPGIITDSCTVKDTFALAFDDSMSPFTRALLGVLARNNVTATFFVNAYNYGDVSTDPKIQQLLIDMDKAGHQVGSHTYDHQDLTVLSMDDLWAAMSRNDVVFKRVLGKRPLYLRPPYVNYNDTVLKVMKSWGYAVVGSDMDNEDWIWNGGPGWKFQQFGSVDLAGFRSNTTARGNTSLSLNHDTGATIIQWSQLLIDKVKAKGLRLVSVAECLGVPNPNQWYRQ